MKSDIEWTDYSLNPVKGLCPVGCEYCYARKFYLRFKWNPAIRYEPEVMKELARIPDGSRIFWGSTIDLFHDDIPAYALEQIFEACRIHDNLIHIFLTKQPHNLEKWSPFPGNCWVGVSVTSWMQFTDLDIGNIRAGLKFISFEPLLEYLPMDGLNLVVKGIDWVIIGARTPHSEKTAPQVHWVREIIRAADSAGIPVFLKDNLKWPRLTADGSPPIYKRTPFGPWRLRQELPVEVAHV